MCWQENHPLQTTSSGRRTDRGCLRTLWTWHTCNGSHVKSEHSGSSQIFDDCKGPHSLGLGDLLFTIPKSFVFNFPATMSLLFRLVPSILPKLIRQPYCQALLFKAATLHRLARKQRDCLCFSGSIWLDVHRQTYIRPLR